MNTHYECHMNFEWEWIFQTRRWAGQWSLCIGGCGVICDYTASCVIHSWALSPSGVHTYSMMKHVSRSAWRVLDVLQRVSNHWGPAECSWRHAYQKNISALLHFVSGHPFSDKCLFSSRLTWCNGFVTQRPTQREKYANNTVCDFITHYGGGMVQWLYQIVMPLYFLYTVELKDYHMHLHSIQCISKNSNQ